MRTRNLFIIILVTLLSTSYFFFGFTSNNFFIQQKQENKKNLPENPLDGRIVFERKGCINCHSINGFGGHTAPDFGAHNFFRGGYDLITGMWNHSPNMIKKMEEMKIDQQKFNANDFRNLRFFIYFLGYLGNNGSVSKGQKLFIKMKCENCHSIGEADSHKISLDKIGVYASPLYLAQVMWNHAAQMQKKQKSSNIKTPLFKDNEFADLSSYIAAISTYGKRRKIYMSPGNPVKGEKLFVSKGCSYCHVKEQIGPNLMNANLNKSVNEIAGMMWNHSAVMGSAMQKNKISWPSFNGNEMANLIAYLYFNNEGKIKGSIEEGKRLVEEKGCINCHHAGNSYNALASPDIGPFPNQDDFFSKLWNHIPLIEKNLYTKGKSLPKMLAAETKSLYLYFNRKNR